MACVERTGLRIGVLIEIDRRAEQGFVGVAAVKLGPAAATKNQPFDWPLGKLVMLNRVFCF